MRATSSRTRPSWVVYKRDGSSVPMSGPAVQASVPTAIPNTAIHRDRIDAPLFCHSI